MLYIIVISSMVICMIFGGTSFVQLVHSDQFTMSMDTDRERPELEDPAPKLEVCKRESSRCDS